MVLVLTIPYELTFHLIPSSTIESCRKNLSYGVQSETLNPNLGQIRDLDKKCSVITYKVSYVWWHFKITLFDAKLSIKVYLVLHVDQPGLQIKIRFNILDSQHHVFGLFESEILSMVRVFNIYFGGFIWGLCSDFWVFDMRIWFVDFWFLGKWCSNLYFCCCWESSWEVVSRLTWVSFLTLWPIFKVLNLGILILEI